MDITEIKHIARLTRVELEDKEAEELAQDLSKIVEMVDQLGEIKLDNVEMTHQVSGLESVTRGDEQFDRFNITSDELIEASPQHRDRFITVKKILEHKD